MRLSTVSSPGGMPIARPTAMGEQRARLKHRRGRYDPHKPARQLSTIAADQPVRAGAAATNTITAAR